MCSSTPALSSLNNEKNIIISNSTSDDVRHATLRREMGMIILTKISQYKFAVIILFIFFLTVLNTEAAELKGTVIGKDNTQKKYIRVKICGKTTFTNEKGIFKVDIDKGEYIITISERNRSMKFNISISKETENITFKLKW
ncbi:MAG: hypothetical protein SCABRO_03190 [Candidatus Scalindua brodae]|uniref:Uncharacterized protein n=1 Tax=Candidatus Scalindua brodae TaxID=237368 RepID=A0A0B0EEP8_9BACT|nr:MAG: hypothetical protein SCABRO_03190 [Candidatus Scalindua brodae]